jgi:hypothetical protein
MATILYVGRLNRRLPESEAEKLRMIADSVADARMVMAAVPDAGNPEPLNAAQKTVIVPAPEQPSPSPGVIGRKAEAKATRRRG